MVSLLKVNIGVILKLLELVIFNYMNNVMVGCFVFHEPKLNLVFCIMSKIKREGR